MRVGEYPISDPDFFTNSPEESTGENMAAFAPISPISLVAVTRPDSAYDAHTPPLKREFDVPAVHIGLVDHAACVLCTGRRHQARCGPSVPAVG